MPSKFQKSSTFTGKATPRYDPDRYLNLFCNFPIKITPDASRAIRYPITNTKNTRTAEYVYSLRQ